MKVIIILILLSLSFSYSINAEEKKGTNSSSEIKVLEERINGIEKQMNIKLKALKDELAMGKLYLIGAVVLAAVLGFFAVEISAGLRRKEEEKEKQKIITESIVSDCLKFVFKTRDIIVNFYIRKQGYLDIKEKDPSRAAKLLSRINDDRDEEVSKGFNTEMQFHLVELQRLENKEIWHKYCSIVGTQMQLWTMLLTDDLFGDAKNKKDEWQKLANEFTDYCIEILKG